MDNDLVLIEKNQGVATVTMNRPDALNALSVALRQAIVETFHHLRDDAKTEVIILTGAGRAFTVGLDLKELGGEVVPSQEVSPNRNDAITDTWQHTNNQKGRISNHPNNHIGNTNVTNNTNSTNNTNNKAGTNRLIWTDVLVLPLP